MFTRVVNRFSRPARASMTRTAARFNNTVAPQQTQQANSGKSYLPYGCGLAFAGMGVKQSDGSKVETIDDIQIPEGAVSVTSETDAHVHAENGDLQDLKDALANGDEIDAKDQDGMTPLMRATKAGHFEVCEWLLANGAQYDIADNEGWTAFFWAVEKGHKRLTEYLLLHVNESEREEFSKRVDTRGLNAVHLACWQGHKHLIHFLAKSGVDVHGKTLFGETPLHHAAFKGHLDICKLLIDKYGSSAHTPDYSSRTPLLIGRTHPMREMRDYFMDLIGTSQPPAAVAASQ